MLEAELHHKLSAPLQNSEDILTSSVIGVFEYLSSPFYIQTILEKAVNIQGNVCDFSQTTNFVEYHFWPRLENCEPDVLICLKDEGGQTYLVCIEAKYWSPRSSNEDESVEFDKRSNGQRDQLAREIEDMHNSSTHELLKVSTAHSYKNYLVYLTNHTSMPVKEIKESYQFVREEYKANFSIENIYWLPWREFHNVVKQIDHFRTIQDEKLLKNLQKLLVKKGLQSFQGFADNIQPVQPFNSVYQVASEWFPWSSTQDVIENQWKYEGDLNGQQS